MSNTNNSNSATCSHDRFKDWTLEDFDREKKRIDRQLRHLEDVIPKLKKEQQRQKMKAFDPTI